MTTGQLALPNAAERLIKLIGEGEELVEGACEVLRELLAQARADESRPTKAVVPAQAELVRNLRLARETERSYHDWRIRNSGELAPGEIDFDALRDKVRERLDHLRETLRSRGIPEQPE